MFAFAIWDPKIEKPSPAIASASSPSITGMTGGDSYSLRNKGAAPAYSVGPN
jgi:hypothetical protein